MNNIDELLTRGIATIVPGKGELKKLLESGKKLNIYFGIDPTATRIHLGHAVPIRKLQQFVEAGHNVTFLIGDYTAQIGDTSDKESERPVLSRDEIEANFQTYKRQAEKILDFSKVTVRHNSEWLGKLGFEDILKLTREFSVNDFISRELIRKRLNEGKRVALQEVLYPVMQGYDSYILDTDVQIGGTDQIFNIQAGRTLIQRLRNKESFALTTLILESASGAKMSKTADNTIWLEDEPEQMYAKIMAIPDALIPQYFVLATNLPLDKIREIEQELQTSQNPMSIKKQLAFQIVKELHNEQAAFHSQENFSKTVQQGQLPQEIPTFETKPNKPLVDVAIQSGLVESKSEFKRLIEQNGVRVNTEIVSDLDQPVNDNDLIEIGKRRILRVKTI